MPAAHSAQCCARPASPAVATCAVSAEHCGAVRGLCPEAMSRTGRRRAAGTELRAEAPLTPAAQPSSYSWSRSAASCDVDITVALPSSTSTAPDPNYTHWESHPHCWAPAACRPPRPGHPCICKARGGWGPGVMGHRHSHHCGQSRGPRQHKRPLLPSRPLHQRP